MVKNNKDVIEQYKHEHNLPKDTILYAYGEWVKNGYRPRKGEASKHKIIISKCGKAGRFYKKEVCFFDETQVEKI